MGLLDAWEEMERKASAITQAKNQAAREVDLKIEAIKKYNRNHPITQAKSIAQIDSQHHDDVEPSTIIYNSADYVLSYLFPPNRKKKKK